MDVASRHHLRSDAIRDLRETLTDDFGVDLDADTFELVEFENSPFDLVLVNGDPLAGYFEDDPFLTVRGANATDPTGHVVTVDAGAVQFVSDGADVMRPGIVEATADIEPGDLVVVVEETHGKALAIGRARVPGDEMTGDAGKVVDSVHHVGDDLYEVAL